MKSRSNPFFRPACFVAALTLALTATRAHATVYYWDNVVGAGFGAAGGTWGTSTNWSTDATGVAAPSVITTGTGDDVNFGTSTLGLTTGSITVGTVSARNIIFGAASGAITLSGGSITLAGNVTTSGTPTTTHTINSDIVLIGSRTFGSVQANEKFIFGGNISGSGASLTADTQNGTGAITLNGTNSFSGNVTITRGQMNVNTVADKLANSSLGAGSKIFMGGGGGQTPTLWYTGTSAGASNRDFDFNSSSTNTVVSQGAALTLSGTFRNTAAGLTATLSLSGDAGGGANLNEVSGAIQDNGTSLTAVQVVNMVPVGGTAENGFWKLSGNNNYSGTTQVTGASTLVIAHNNALGSTTGNTSVSNTSQLLLTGNIAVGAEALTLNSSATASWNGQTGAALRNYSGTNSWAGAIALGQHTTIAANSGGSLTVSGAISGGFNLTKADTGTLALAGANTYTGTTTIAAGTLQADRADVAATSGALGNGGAINFTGGTLQFTANSAGTNYSTRIVNSTTAAIKLDTNGQNVTFGSALASTNTAGLTKEGAGQLDLKMSTAAQYSGTTTINGGTLKFTNTADLAGISGANININNGSTLVVFSNVGGSNRTTFNNGKIFTFGSTGGGTILYDSGSHLWQTSGSEFVTTGGSQNSIITASGGFINPQNTNTVNFVVADGTDAVDLLVSVTVGSGNYTKSGAGTLSITSSSNLGGGAAPLNLTINTGTFDVGGSARLTTVGQSTGVVTSDILNNGVYRHSSSGAQTLGGVMSGTGAMTQNGSGTLTLSGANTYTGQTTISTGTLQIGAGSTTGKLSASSAIVNNANLTINRSDAATQGTDFSSAAITGTGSLTAAGSGTTTLNAANSYSGGTTVNAGADLRINGAQTGVGTVTVTATGKLGGSGSVIGGINVSGILAPGNSIESLGGGVLSFLTGSTYAYELSTLGLNGDLTYSSGTLSIATGTILTLTDLSTSTALANGSKLTLISSVGAWNLGLFSYNAGAGLATLNDDSDITLGLNTWRFNYNDTLAGSNFTGNTTGATNFVTMTVVPEPNVAALLGGLGVLALLRRRR